MNVASRELLSSIIYSSSAFLVWTDLKEGFNKINGSKIYQLHRAICVTNQGFDSVSVYFNRLKLLWDEFFSICSLPACSCDQSKARSDHENNIKLFQFLMGLNETYGNVRSNLLMRLPLPSLNEAYSVLIQEESQRELSNIISSGNTAVIFTSKNTGDTSTFYSSTSNSGSNLGRKLWIC